MHIHTHICNRILLIHKNNETLPFVTTWMDRENIMLSEMSCGKGQIPCDFTHRSIRKK